MDHIDQNILKLLQSDARLSHQEIGDRVNLSASPCARRIRKLDKEGYIERYSAQINEQKMGFGFSVFVSVRLAKQIDSELGAFEARVQSCSEIVDCWLMTGKSDYLMRVAVDGLQEFESFLTRKLTKFPGVASIESSIPLRRVKHQLSRLA